MGKSPDYSADSESVPGSDVDKDLVFLCEYWSNLIEESETFLSQPGWRTLCRGSKAPIAVTKSYEGATGPTHFNLHGSQELSHLGLFVSFPSLEYP